MTRYLTTRTDAENLIREWTESFAEQPTDVQVTTAARRLVAYLGGYGADADEMGQDGTRRTDGFDLDAALAQ